MTKMMIEAWVNAVLKPAAKKWVAEGLPLSQFGGILVGYGISMLRGASISEAEIRETVEGVLKTGAPEK